MFVRMLRTIRGATLLGCAFFILLAMQQSYDFHRDYQNPLTDHHPDSRGLDHIAAYHPSGLKDKIRSIRLFRFALPNFELFGFDSHHSSPNLIMKPPQREQPAVGDGLHRYHKSDRPDVLSDRKRTTRLSSPAVYLVEFTNCNPSSMDAATLLKYSLDQSNSRSTSNSAFELHALLPVETNQSFTAALQKIGYQTTVRDDIGLPKSLEQFQSDRCLVGGDWDKFMLQAFVASLNVEVVVVLPLPSMIVSSQDRTFWQQATPARNVQFPANATAAIETKEYGRDAVVRLFQPNKTTLDDLVKRVRRQCLLKRSEGTSTMLTNNNDGTINIGSVYDFKSSNVTILTFRDCPLPWDCDGADLKVSNQRACLRLRVHWFELRHEFELSRSRAEPNAMNKTSLPLKRGKFAEMYCRKGDPMGYVPIVPA